MAVSKRRMSKKRPTSEALRAYFTGPRPTDLARQAGVSRQYISDVLAGRRPASARVVRAAQELGFPLGVRDGAKE